MAEEASNLFDAVRRANRAVWEQASGRKSSDESRAISPPTGRESPLEGADASAMVAALSAKLSALQARVDYIEDDFPESEIGGGDDSAAAYASYFKVIDASVSEEGEVLPKIRVVDGAHSSDPYYTFAGPVYVNGVRENDVPSYTIGVPVVDDEVVDSRLWLIVVRTDIDAECNLSFELRADEDGEPDAVAGTFGYRFIPIARIIGSGGMSFRIVQDHYGPAIATFNTFSGYVVHADGGRTFVGPPTGVYLLVDIITGAARYDDAEPEDKSRMNFYLVAEKIDVENGVVYRPLDGITVGDVRIDFAPYAELPGWQQEET